MHAGAALHTPDMREISTSDTALCPLTRLEKRDGAPLRCDASAPKRHQD